MTQFQHDLMQRLQQAVQQGCLRADLLGDLALNNAA